MKLAIITGGSKGLGKALCEQYLSNDWTLKELSRSGKESYTIPCDFSDRISSFEKVKGLFNELSTQSWDAIHIICNAGRLGEVAPIANIKADDWMGSIDVNFGSLVMVTSLFAQLFQQHDCPKVLAAVSSGAANKDFAGWSLYCSTKAAMNRFVTCFAEEQRLNSSPITSVLISPGVVDTQMQEQIRSANEEYFPQLEYFIKLKSEGNLPEPSYIAKKIYSVLNHSPENGQLYRVADY